MLPFSRASNLDLSLVASHSIRQLVAVVGPARKVTRKKITRFFNGPDNSLRKKSLEELGANARREVVPERFATFLMNALVADDRRIGWHGARSRGGRRCDRE